MTMHDSRTRVSGDVIGEVRDFRSSPSAPSCRATSASPRRPPTGSRRSTTTPTAPAPTPTSRPPRRSPPVAESLSRDRRGLAAVSPSSRRRRRVATASPAPRWSSFRSTRSRPNPTSRAPRSSPPALEALAASLRAAGVLQPVVVAPADAEGRHQLIAGERRWGPRGLAGLERVPAIVRAVRCPRAARAGAGRERRPRGPERDRRRPGVRVPDRGLRTEPRRARERLGRSRPGDLQPRAAAGAPQGVQEAIAAGALTEGHGRAILMADGGLPLHAGRRAGDRRRPVRPGHRGARPARRAARRRPTRRPPAEPTPLGDAALEAFGVAFNAPVRVRTGQRGQVTVEIASPTRTRSSTPWRASRAEPPGSGGQDQPEGGAAPLRGLDRQRAPGEGRALLDGRDPRGALRRPGPRQPRVGPCALLRTSTTTSPRAVVVIDGVGIGVVEDVGDGLLDDPEGDGLGALGEGVGRRDVEIHLHTAPFEPLDQRPRGRGPRVTWGGGRRLPAAGRGWPPGLPRRRGRRSDGGLGRVALEAETVAASSIRPTPTSSCTGPSWRPSATRLRSCSWARPLRRGVRRAPLAPQVREQARVGEGHQAWSASRRRSRSSSSKAGPRVRRTTITPSPPLRRRPSPRARRPFLTPPPAPAIAGGDPERAVLRLGAVVCGRTATVPSACTRGGRVGPHQRARLGDDHVALVERGRHAARDAGERGGDAWRSSSRTRSRRPAISGCRAQRRGPGPPPAPPGRAILAARLPAHREGDAEGSDGGVADPGRDDEAARQADQCGLRRGRALVVHVASGAQRAARPGRGGG